MKKPSAEGPGGGGGKNDLKHNASKSKDRVSRKSPSESSGPAKSSGRSSKSSTVPKRKPEKDMGEVRPRSGGQEVQLRSRSRYPP
ncbi:hypothetical protein MTO96_032343 [Rhipicephalus appendiculatus]